MWYTWNAHCDDQLYISVERRQKYLVLKKCFGLLLPFLLVVLYYLVGSQVRLNHLKNNHESQNEKNNRDIIVDRNPAWKRMVTLYFYHIAHPRWEKKQTEKQNKNTPAIII